jgi:hypothetical protein
LSWDSDRNIIRNQTGSFDAKSATEVSGLKEDSQGIRLAKPMRQRLDYYRSRRLGMHIDFPLNTPTPYPNAPPLYPNPPSPHIPLRVLFYVDFGGVCI